MVVREKNCYYAIALTDFFVFLSCAETKIIKSLKNWQKISVAPNRYHDGW